MDATALLTLISARRSCRAYKEEQIPKELLEQVLQAGRFAPSGKNVQLCHFLALQRRQHLKTLRDLATELFSGMALPSGNASIDSSVKAAQKGSYDFFYSAPTLIIVANQRDNINQLCDSAVALQNMMLMATALGLGSCWINQLRWLGDAPQMRNFLRELGLKDDELPCGALALGYAKKEPGAVLERTGNIMDIIE